MAAMIQAHRGGLTDESVRLAREILEEVDRQLPPEEPSALELESKDMLRDVMGTFREIIRDAKKGDMPE
jgi:hypothetical protein